MNRIVSLLAVALSLSLLVAFQASAATVTYLVTFSANTFQLGSGTASAPVDPVTGSFTITFDPTQTYGDTTAGITLNSLNISLGSPLSFNYDPSSGNFQVGGSNDLTCCITHSPSTNDFWLYIQNFPTSPKFNQLGYSQTSVSSDNLFYTENNTGSVTVTLVNLWQNAISLGDGWYYLGPFGAFNTNGAPWIYHQSLGWLYPAGTSTDSIWFYDPQWDGTGGWWWTSSSLFPWIYSVTEKEWLYYDAKATGARWFFNTSGQAATH